LLDLFFDELMALARRPKLPTQELRGKKQSMTTMMMMIHTIHGRARKQRRRRNTGMEALAQESESLALGFSGIEGGEDEEARGAKHTCSREVRVLGMQSAGAKKLCGRIGVRV
jgi:hypothetical protein